MQGSTQSLDTLSLHAICHQSWCKLYVLVLVGRNTQSLTRSTGSGLYQIPFIGPVWIYNIFSPKTWRRTYLKLSYGAECCQDVFMSPDWYDIITYFHKGRLIFNIYVSSSTLYNSKWVTSLVSRQSFATSIALRLASLFETIKMIFCRFESWLKKVRGGLQGVNPDLTSALCSRFNITSDTKILD